MNIFVSIYAWLQYREAVRRADKAHAECGNRYYVMPNAGGKIKLIVTDRKNFRQMRLKHYIDSSVKMDDVTMKCFYFTPDRQEKNAIDDFMRDIKLRMYYEWYEKRRARDIRDRKRKRKDWLRRISSSSKVRRNTNTIVK